MKEYKIISIEDNKNGSDGHIIIVKANPLEFLKVKMGNEERILGANFCSHECSDTEYFVYPYTTHRVDLLVNQAKRSDENVYWQPIMTEFYDSKLLFLDGRICSIHKHNSFNKQLFKSGIQNIIDTIKGINQVREAFAEFDLNAINVSDVKGISLCDNSIYSGKALVNGNLCIPTGYGSKRFMSDNNKRIISYYKNNEVGNIAFIEYPQKYMYIGGVIDSIPNGWGFILAKGQLTFGYYKDGELYKDLSPFVMDIYSEMSSIGGIQIGHIDGLVNRLAIGVLPNENRSFIGLQFSEDGSVYIGKGYNNNEYEITGQYIHLEIDGKATIGIFDKGKLLKQMTQKEYYQYAIKCVGQERIDLSGNYLRKKDSGLYLIASLQQYCDFNLGRVILIKALPYDELDVSALGEVSYKGDIMEYFYLREDENVVSMIKKYAQERLLWKIKLDDFHTNYHSVLDLDPNEPLERNVHIHNRLIGLEYTCLTNFEIMPIHVEEDISDIPVIDDDDLPF